MGLFILFVIAGGIRVWYKHQHDPATKLREKRAGAAPFGTPRNGGGRTKITRADARGLWLSWAALLTNNYPVQLWTPSRAPGTLTKPQRKQACRSAKHAKARSGEGIKEPAASSWGAGTIPLGAAVQDREAPRELDWHHDLAADLADPPATTRQGARQPPSAPQQQWRSRRGQPPPQ